VGENQPTPGMLPKVDKFSIVSYDETVDKNQFYISQNALKLAYSNVEFQKFSRKSHLQTLLEGQGKETEGRGKGEGVEDEGKRVWESPIR